MFSRFICAIGVVLATTVVCVPVVLAESAGADRPAASEDAASKEIVLTIGGMSCESCVQSITSGLKSTVGVEDAHVTLEPPRAVVKLKPVGAPSAEELVKVVTDLGYTATPATK